MPTDIVLFTLIGFAAQLVDGALGMAYGVIATTVLLSTGISPVAASASVHSAEIVTTAVSGFSHWRLGNIDRSVVLSLLIPGVAGGVIGAYLLTSIPESITRPLVSIYLMFMGVVILLRAFQHIHAPAGTVQPALLGLAGGFFDAIGGGGWGPIVTSTLLADGHEPRYTVGSVNLAEFFVTTAQAATFALTIGPLIVQNWPIIAGLLIGGALGAPVAAVMASRLPARTMLIMVGVLIILLSLRTISLAFFQ